MRTTTIMQGSNVRLCCLLFVILISMTLAQNNSTLSRNKRYLIFPKGARGGIRVNFKHNRVVPITTILAYSDGLRLTWDLPTTLAQLRPMVGRSVDQLEVMDFLKEAVVGHGLDGEACIMRAMCESATQPTPSAGIIRKILHRIFYLPSQDNMEQQALQDCETRFAHLCPISLLGPSNVRAIQPQHETHPRD